MSGLREDGCIGGYDTARLLKHKSGSYDDYSIIVGARSTPSVVVARGQIDFSTRPDKDISQPPKASLKQNLLIKYGLTVLAERKPIERRCLEGCEQKAGPPLRDQVRIVEIDA